MSSPYTNLASKHRWRNSVSSIPWEQVSDLYRKKFDFRAADKIGTAGSCFAQHIASRMRANGYTVLDRERAPGGLSAEHARKYGYGIYSARYGNIYAVPHLLQLLREAFDGSRGPDAAWEKKGRYYDPMRPGVEPDGLSSVEEVLAHRADHLQHVQSLFSDLDVFVFTLGLTEAWIHRRTGWVFPTCPGVMAGTYDPNIYQFRNYGFCKILEDLVECRRLIKALNGSARFLLTVSPVPLVATATPDHVVVATTYSKSVLRGVAGEFTDSFDDVAYFPSYEIITSPASRGRYFESDLREVTQEGVDAVMRVFFDAHGVFEQEAPKRRGRMAGEALICEEVLNEVAS
jgi:GSCFA family